MGYDIHITRAHEWLDSSESPISLAEWLSYVHEDPGMRQDGFAEATTPAGDTIRTESEGLAVWTAHSKHGVGQNMAWFDWHDGHIVCKNPDDEILKKMKAIAGHFHAKVQGDELEEYGA